MAPHTSNEICGNTNVSMLDRVHRWKSNGMI